MNVLLLLGLDLNRVSRDQTKEAEDDYNFLESGLNYLGHCKQTGCLAYGKAITCRKGIGSFLVHEHVMNGDIKSVFTRLFYSSVNHKTST